MDHRSLHRRIDQVIDNLPTLSPSVRQIIELANDLQASPRDLMNIIKVDPVLTGKILHLVNSSYFSMQQPITSLNRSLILLGFNTIKNIALTTAFVEATAGIDKNQRFNLEDLWLHLLSVGCLSKIIARHAGQPRSELDEYFIAGLMHDIGDMILMQAVPDEFQAALSAATARQESALACEKAHLNITGPAVGLSIARHWKLPANLQQVIDRNFETSDPMTLNLLHTVYLADKHCRAAGLGFVSDTRDMTITDADLAKAGLSLTAFALAKSELPAVVEKAKVFINKKGS